MTETITCEICEEETSIFIACSKCGRFICPNCEAADEEEEDEPICEECF